MTLHIRGCCLLVLLLTLVTLPTTGKAATAATLSFPSPEIAVGASSNFSWQSQSGASGYWLSIKDELGKQYGQQLVYSAGTRSVQIDALPAGQPLEVVLYTLYPAGSGTNWDNRSTYQLNAPASRLKYPYEQELDGTEQWIIWQQVKGASSYYLTVSDDSGNRYFQRNMQLADRVKVAELPDDGRNINIKLHTVVGNNWDRVISKTFSSHAGSAGTAGSLTAGFDWSVPGSYSSNGGLVDKQWNRPPNHDIRPAYVNATTYDLTWKETYDDLARHGDSFHSFDNFLDTYADGRDVLVRLETTSRCHLPEELKNSFNYYGGTSIAFWENTYLSELNQLVSLFGSRFANDPRVIGVYVGIADGEYLDRVTGRRLSTCSDTESSMQRAGWGEMNMEEPELASAISQGFTLENLTSSAKAIMDFYANAFRGNEKKLAYMNFRGFVFDDPQQTAVASGTIAQFNQTHAQLADYSQDRGLGNRDGLVENWMGYTEKNYGMTFSSFGDSCYMGMNENFADAIQGRYWGTENEEYGNEQWLTDRYGSFTEQPYRFMISSLRALQMRRNYVTINSAGMKQIPGNDYRTDSFLEYLAKTVGRTRSDTPDAFVVHGERYVRQDQMGDYDSLGCYSNNHARIREFGRWLTEIEAGGSPAMLVDLAENTYMNSMSYGLPARQGTTRYEYQARSHNRFTYDIDDSLVNNRCEATCSIEVKVVFEDVTQTTLVIENQQGILGRVNTTGQGGTKTATFQVNTQLANAHLGGDFTVRTENNTDVLPVMLTRVNFPAE